MTANTETARRPAEPAQPTPTELPAPTLLVRIDPSCGLGLQQQVYAGIRRAILEGLLSPGTRLPSSRALAQDLGLSRTTTVLAYDQLRAEGYLTARRSSGVFVAHDLPDTLPQARPGVRPAGGLPPVSRRCKLLAAIEPPARRVGVAARPFRLGVPALDLFPIRIWSQLATRRLRSASAAQLDYGFAAGQPALREAIAEHVQRARATRCDPDDVIVAGGAQGALELACQVLLDPGDAAWMEDPGYSGARRALLGAGARLVPVPVDGEGLCVEEGARLAPGARLAYVSPSHQFPLGVPLSLPRRLSLLQWASGSGAWILEDDYDAEFRYGAHPIPCLHGLDSDGRVIYVGTFAKTLFPALRLGFLVVPPALRDHIIAIRRTGGGLLSSTLDQLVLAEFISAGHYDRHLRRMTAAYRERLEALAEAAERHCAGALRLRPTRTGLHAVADLAEGVDDGRVCELARDRGLEVMPLSSYYAGPGPRQSGLLLGFGTVRPEGLAPGMELLAAAIEAARRPAAPRSSRP